MYHPELRPRGQAAIDALERGGWTVALYLAGRSLLDPSMSRSEAVDPAPDSGNERSGTGPSGTFGRPLVISGRVDPGTLPDLADLREIGGRVLRAAGIMDRAETTSGTWSVDVRPVRADRQECLVCHQPAEDERTGGRPGPPLAIGDALGVLIYVHRRSTP